MESDGAALVWTSGGIQGFYRGYIQEYIGDMEKKMETI